MKAPGIHMTARMDLEGTVWSDINQTDLTYMGTYGQNEWTNETETGL